MDSQQWPSQAEASRELARLIEAVSQRPAAAQTDDREAREWIAELRRAS